MKNRWANLLTLESQGSPSAHTWRTGDLPVHIPNRGVSTLQTQRTGGPTCSHPKKKCIYSSNPKNRWTYLFTSQKEVHLLFKPKEEVDLPVHIPKRSASTLQTQRTGGPTCSHPKKRCIYSSNPKNRWTYLFTSQKEVGLPVQPPIRCVPTCSAPNKRWAYLFTPPIRCVPTCSAPNKRGAYLFSPQ